MITIDELDEAHARVAIDLLEADGGVPAFHGNVPDDTRPPYALVYTAVQWPGNPLRLNGRTGTCTTRWYVHCAGATDEAARAVANRVRQLLRDVRPTIAGRSCGFIRQESALPPVRDETTGTPVLDLVAIYTLTTYAG